MSDPASQGTPGCLCEHASISRALVTARLPGVPVWTDSLAQHQELPGVVLTWSSPKDLLLSPRWAWLEWHGVRVVQLPVGYQELQRLFAEAARPIRCPADHASKTHVTGQFQWALRQLSKRLDADNSVEVPATPSARTCSVASCGRQAFEASAGAETPTRGYATGDGSHGVAALAEPAGRLSELDRFAGCHWPSWYAEVFCEVRRALGDGGRNRAKALLDLAGEVSDEVAALQPLGPLFHGSAEDVVNRGAGPARAAIGGVLSGALLPAQGQAVLRRDRWWEGLAATLAACQQQLRDLAKAENQAALDIGEQVAEMQELLERFSAFAREVCQGRTGSARCLSENWGAAQVALGRLMDLVGALSRRREALRERIRESQGLGQDQRD